MELRQAVLKAPLRRPVRPAPLPIRLIIADDHALVRDGLRALLSAEADFVVLGEAHDPESTLELIQALRPDVLLLDASLARAGLEFLQRLQAVGHSVQTILVASSLDRQQVVAALRLGARGIVFRNTRTDLLFQSIRRVRAGEIWITREAVADVVAALVNVAPTPPSPSAQPDFGLTAREHDVLRRLVEGETTKGLAAQLAVGPDTVKHHLTSIFNKTGASNRLELALFALYPRLVPPLS
jgi:DNA-binding NarL/FixJ family response regulator